MFEVAGAGEWSPSDIPSYEALDKTISDSMRHAERVSGNKYTNRFDWSPTMIQAVQTIRYWNLILKRSKGGWVAQTTLNVTHEYPL
jgi:hypothetical protein